jgi:pimeloyl-ACP methyl ester carboxylesterase
MLERIKSYLGEAPDERHVPWRATFRHGRATARDGTSIYYEVVGRGDRTILLANGLGGRLYAWSHLIEDLWRDFRIITWDYRGLFESESPARRRLSVVHHADDAEAILEAERATRAVLCGWSMGVQVSLELAGSSPATTAGLVLINGTYGHALSTSFQPFVSVPFLPKRVHSLLEWLQARPELTHELARLVRLAELPTAAAFGLTAGPKVLRHRRLIRQYFDDVLGPSFGNYLRLFQELDAHSAYHLLPMIKAPTLIVSGMLDPLTPAFQSREMARRMPNARYLPLKRAGHFVLMERPEVIVPAVRRFLDHEVDW